MTVKEKILKKIHDEMDGLVDAQGNFEYPEHEGAFHALCNLEAYIDSLPEESVSKDLEEEINRYTDNAANYLEYNDGWGDSNDIEYIEKAARHFANWQKEQMMKDVVLETTIIRDDDGCAEDGNYSSWLEYTDSVISNIPDWAEEGDKVKLIIIKED